MSNVAIKHDGEKRTDSTSGERTFVVTDASSISDALTATLNYLTANNLHAWGGFTAGNATATTLNKRRGAYEVTVPYTPFGQPSPSPQPTGSVTYSWNTRLESQRVYQAKSLIATENVAGYTPSTTGHGGAIGVTVDKEGSIQVEGTDKLFPVSDFSITIRPAVADVDEAWQKLAGALVGKVNSQPFYGRSAGEVLFAGRRGSLRSDADYEIQLDFLERPNETGINIGAIPTFSKDGWDFIDVERVEEVGAGGAMELVPKAAYIRRLYERDNLNQLVI